MATTDLHFIAGALQPVKRGIRLLGGNVDDGVQIDASSVGIVVGNHTMGSFAAWIMVPDNTGTYCIWGTGDANAVEYTTLDVEAGTIKMLMIKATPTTMIDVNTPANSIKPHTWHHVCVVQNADILEIYIDGVVQVLTWTTATTPGQWFADLNNIDSGTIGAADSVAGGALLTEEFAGYIADVRLWSGTTSASVLTQEQVKDVMSGKSVGAPYNAWTLNQNLLDTGTGADNGTADGDIIYSDACEFSSRLTFLETVPLAANNVSIMADGGVGYAYTILAA